MPTQTLMAWSSGKDSAYALWTLRQQPDIEVVGLVTTMNSAVDRVSMHGVSESVLDFQARACGLPLLKVPLPDPCTDENYQATMSEVIAEARERGVEAMAFGDLFLEGVRAYREAQLADTGIVPLFPLWGRPTAALAEEMIEAGVEAIITCVDTEQLDRSFVGRTFDRSLLADLPASADPCAENGEFHSAVIAGPMFRQRLDVEVGQMVDHGRFVWVDLRLVPASASLR